jgi:hypothetical protein
VTIESPRLSIELVPQPLWGTSNIRSILPRADWDALRRHVYVLAGYRCEICGGKGATYPLECHEVWAYDEDALTQKLVRLIGLCPACHEVKHYGRSCKIGRGEEARAHLQKVNGWDPLETSLHIHAATTEWKRRSANPGWKLVVDWDEIARTYGVPLSLTGTKEYPASGRTYA